MRSDAALSRLTEEQKADLFDWLTVDTYAVVLKRVAQPPPEGFGLKTHVNSLHRFYEQRQADLRALDLAKLSEQQPDSSGMALQAAPLLSRQSFFSAASSAFAHSTYVLANSPVSALTYTALSDALHQNELVAVKREYLDLARQQLALGRERLQFDRAQFEYNAARAAIALLPDLIAIDRLTDIDDESKIWRVRDRLFGASPSPSPSPSAPPEQF